MTIYLFVIDNYQEVLFLDSWNPDYQEFQELFSNDYSLKILSIIYLKSKTNETPCGHDIAKILNIHISTATKYLDLLYKYKFIEREQITNKPGKPTYYKTKTKSISITLDLPLITQNLQNFLEEVHMPDPLLREKINLAPRVKYNLNDNGTIESIMIKTKTKAKKLVKRELTLNNIESNFMKYIPFPTMKAARYSEICSDAGLNDILTRKELYYFVENLAKYDIIELVEG